MGGDLEQLHLVVDAIRDFKGLEPLSNLEIEANLRTDLGLDSLDLAELAVRVEAKTGKDVFHAPLPNTVRDIVERMGGAGGEHGSSA